MSDKPSLPHIGLSRFSFIPDAVLAEFVDEVAAEPLRIEVREQESVFAGLEWLNPTAVVLFISGAYFAAFFSELGKDHYTVLKRAVRTLYRRMSALRLTRRGTPGKFSAEPVYSLAFSIVVATGQDINLKLLLQPALSEDDAARAVEAFFTLVASLFEGTTPPEVQAELNKGRVVGRTLLLAFDFDTGSIVTIDPIQPGIRSD
jgi:hypothetical protein